uniref:DDE_Tnp_1_7 domain-containing protein n=1 Tax=Rhodnius prolixus TaxID=13249 RepID=T1I3L1_RHOPR
MSSRSRRLVDLARSMANDFLIDSESDDFDSDDSIHDKKYLPSSSLDANANIPISETEEEEEEVSRCDSGSSWGSIKSSNPEFQEFNNAESTFNLNTTIKEVLEAYQVFVNDELIDLIVKETNRYAQQLILKKHSSKSRISFWKNTDREIKNFFAVVLTMGLVQISNINLYWCKDPIYHNSFISSLMSRDRFLLLLKCLHFSNNEDDTNKQNRLRKIEPLIGILTKNFSSVISHGKELVIDESLIPFRGRLIFRQYIPNKAHKYGIKIYKLCTPQGYTSNFIIYAGKGSTDKFRTCRNRVRKLLEKIGDGEGRTLYADNFYSNLPLAQHLYEKFYCGTLRSNRRGLPKPLVTKKLKKGEIIGQEYNKIKIIKWQDKRPVLMLTTVASHDDSLINSGRCNRNGEPIRKPNCVLDYNKAKQGVDLSDQMSSYSTVLRKGTKWYRKLAFELLFGTSLVNAWVLYNTISINTKIGITEFRRILTHSLAENKLEDKSPSNKRAHTFIKPEGPGRKKRKACVGCYKLLCETMSSREADKQVRRIISFCQECEGQPGYCLNCFNLNHK